MYSYLDKVPQKMLLSTRYELLTAATCELIAHSICKADIDASHGLSTAVWRSTINFALKSPSVVVQEAAATAMVSVSKLVNCSNDVARYVILHCVRFRSVLTG